MTRRTVATTILAIETSCDETAVAMVRCRRRRDGYAFEVIENLVHSQIPVHRKTGGVVPEVAAREHAVRLPLLLEQLSHRYGLSGLEHRVDAVAVTAGPGLITSLLVGVEVARTIAYAWQKPLVPVNHLEGHIYANLLDGASLPNPNLKIPISKSKAISYKLEARSFTFPLLALIVSGGHTELVLMKKHLNYRLLGSTRDDAAGEAFDKTAKLLGLPYPGGSALAALARRGNPSAVAFPRPMLDQPNLDFSFAGLKTAVAIHLQKNHSGILKNTRMTKAITRADMAASFQAATVETLVGKTLRAARRYRPRTVVLAGGVAANQHLRTSLRTAFGSEFPGVTVLEPTLAYATDNAAMIGAAGAVRHLNGYTAPWEKVKVDPQLALR